MRFTKLVLVLSIGLTIGMGATDAFALKLDNIPDTGFAVGQLACGPTFTPTGCDRTDAFDVVDPNPPLTAGDTVGINVLSVKEGELISGTVKFTFAAPPTHIPTAGTVKAGTEFLPFVISDIGGNMFAGTFDLNNLNNKGASNIVIDVVMSPVPLPAAAWLFLSAIGGLAGLRKLRHQA